MKKKKFKGCIFTVLLALFNFFLVMQVFAEPTIDILIPSAGQASVIPPGKDFYVLGNLYGLDKQADLSLKVYLTTASGEVVRELEAISFHKPENTYVNYDLLSYYAGSDRSPLANALMPDLVYDNKNINSFADAWRKVCFSTKHYAALISGGVYDRDLQLVGKTGEVWRELEQGNYQVKVVLSQDNKVLATATKNIEVAINPDVACFRFSPSMHFDRVKEFANSNNIKMLIDPLAGFWHPADNLADFKNNSVFAEILPKWRWNDLAEYQNNHIHFFIYNVSETSATYKVEVGTAQKQGIIADNERFTSYYYSYGEPQINGAKPAEFVKFANDQYLVLTRLDFNSDGQENLLDPSKLDQSNSVLNMDTNKILSVNRKFALSGLVRPIQNKQIVDNSDNTFDFNHRLLFVRYTISNGKQKQVFNRKIGLTRIIDSRKRESILEFEHEFNLSSNWHGLVNVKAEVLDENGQVYPGQTTQLSLQVA
ncbi:hypothetical protein [Amygdalobacter nucleatus]|nr:hypothetical protein [Amygdalobacter nucleatus]MDF0485747.1 hypothetical protein [Amygdalobacter nucleatus]